MLNRARDVDTFACGLKIARGTRVVMPYPYRQEGTYQYPSLGVSSLTNATVCLTLALSPVSRVQNVIRHD